MVIYSSQPTRSASPWDSITSARFSPPSRLPSSAPASAPMQWARSYSGTCWRAASRAHSIPSIRRTRKCRGSSAYASIEQIGAPVELAVICTKAETVPDIIEACGKHGVRAAVVLSAGFSETGQPGRRRSNAPCWPMPRTYGVRIIGPNCLGIMRTGDRAQRHFLQGQRQARKSRAGFAVGRAVHGHARLGAGQ